MTCTDTVALDRVVLVLLWRKGLLLKLEKTRIDNCARVRAN